MICSTYKSTQKSKESDRKYKFKKGEEHSKRASDKTQSGSNKRSNDKVLTNVKCYNCHKKGHYSNMCPEKGKTSNLNRIPVTVIADAKKEEGSPKPTQWKP